MAKLKNSRTAKPRSRKNGKARVQQAQSAELRRGDSEVHQDTIPLSIGSLLTPAASRYAARMKQIQDNDMVSVLKELGRVVEERGPYEVIKAMDEKTFWALNRAFS